MKCVLEISRFWKTLFEEYYLKRSRGLKNPSWGHNLFFLIAGKKLVLFTETLKKSRSQNFCLQKSVLVIYLPKERSRNLSS